MTAIQFDLAAIPTFLRCQEYSAAIDMGDFRPGARMRNRLIVVLAIIFLVAFFGILFYVPHVGYWPYGGH